MQLLRNLMVCVVPAGRHAPLLFNTEKFMRHVQIISTTTWFFHVKGNQTYVVAVTSSLHV